MERDGQMPSTSKAQEKFMAAAAHNPKFARKAGIKQSVAREYNRADQAKKGKRPHYGGGTPLGKVRRL